jgi:hypothetical protein
VTSREELVVCPRVGVQAAGGFLLLVVKTLEEGEEEDVWLLREGNMGDAVREQ